MAKELGQIHQVNFGRNGIDATLNNTLVMELDLPGRLSSQLQRMVRQGNYFKVVGIDVSIGPLTAPPAPGQTGHMTGFIRYFSPTKGRCAAYRHAFRAMAEQMNNQGIPMRENKLYDFRVALSNNPQITALNPLTNNATLDGVNGLALVHSTVPGASVFGVYNDSVAPVDTKAPGDLFAEGFDTLLAAGAAKTDFVLNDAALWEGNDDFANVGVETIPFTLSYGPNGATTFQWRPDPALYQAVMCGLFEIFIEDADTTANQGMEIDVAVSVAGWSSIMSDPDKKKKSSRRKKSSSRMK